MTDETKNDPPVDDVSTNFANDELNHNTGDDETTDDDLKEYYRLLMPEQNMDDIGNALTDENLIHGKDEFLKQIVQVGTYSEIMKRMLDAHTDQTQFLKKALALITNAASVGDEYEYAPQNPDDPTDKPFTLKNRVIKIDKSLGGTEVSGRQAQLLILASNKNVKKIYLYNSGFYITLKGPALVDINNVYNRLSDEMGEYGKMFGAIFYMYSDSKIKSIIWDFILSLVIDSNLNKWDKGNRLRDYVSLLDYQPIILGIGSLMFKNGYEFVHACPVSTCKHTETAVIDLRLMQLTNFSKIQHEQLAFIAKTGGIETDDVRKYRKAINVNPVLDVGSYRIHRRVPSMTDYLTYGEAFNGDMMATIHELNDPKLIDQYLKFNFSRLFEPWITRIEMMNADGTVSFKVLERAAIALVLSEIQNGDDNAMFGEEMNKYIQESMITQIGYLAQPCTKCGAMPSGAVNGIIPFDAQHSFFTMLVMRLIQAS